MNRQKKSFFVLITALSVMTLTSCSNPKDSDEYKNLASDVKALEKEKNDLNNDVESLQSQIANNESLQVKLENLKSQRLERIETLSQLLSEPSSRKKIVNGIGEVACKNYVTAVNSAQGVANYTDDNFYVIAAENLSGLDRILGDIYSKTQDQLPGFKEYWSELEATNCQTEAEVAFFKTCETFDKRQMNKNPEQFKGKCVKGTVRIAQFDSNTGPCSFQGYIGGGYDVRAQFGQVLDPDKHNEEKDCEWTSKLVEDNFITFWAFGLGSFSYDTTSGGKQTVPAFKMVQYSK